MKDQLYQEITSFRSLYQAYIEVSKGKQEKNYTLRFEYDLETNLHDISEMLKKGQVPKVKYQSFYVYVPKVRKVIYIDFANKIIQRAIYDAINPVLCRGFISDTYACIPGRGQLKAMNKVKDWMASTRHAPGDWWYYKYDVSKFFYRMDHEILMSLLKRRLPDEPRLVDLIGYYVCDTEMPFGLPVCVNQLDVGPEDMLHDIGIPIGGGLSHTLGNLYLDPLDQYIKRELRCKRYARYMDDGIIFDSSKNRLKENGRRIEAFANERLKLEFNRKTSIRPVRCGVEWVGSEIYDDYIRLRKSTTLHIKRRLRKTMQDYNRGQITFEEANQTVQSYKALLKYTDMDQFKSALWRWFRLTRGSLKPPIEDGITRAEMPAPIVI